MIKHFYIFPPRGENAPGWNRRLRDWIAGSPWYSIDWETKLDNSLYQRILLIVENPPKQFVEEIKKKWLNNYLHPMFLSGDIYGFEVPDLKSARLSYDAGRNGSEAILWMVENSSSYWTITEEGGILRTPHLYGSMGDLIRLKLEHPDWLIGEI